MLDLNEAQSLMEKFIELREKANESKSSNDIREFKKQQTLCVEKFSYLVTMKTGRYKAFSNYDDLNQIGFESLLKGMKNYNPKKGNAFWWFHKYIDTGISRGANLHTTIRFPLKVAKELTPHKESILPLLIEEKHCPDKEYETSRMLYSIESAMRYLTDEQKSVINLAYGFDGDKPLSTNKICKKLNISRSNCIKLGNSALIQLKEHIKL